MRGTQVALLLACFLTGCDDSSIQAPLVGGPCSYEQFPGMFQVVSVKNGKYQLMFELQSGQEGLSNAITQVPLERLNGWGIEVPIADAALAGAVVGDKFHATASVITQGTCTPVDFSLGSKAASSP